MEREGHHGADSVSLHQKSTTVEADGDYLFMTRMGPCCQCQSDADASVPTRQTNNHSILIPPLALSPPTPNTLFSLQYSNRIKFLYHSRYTTAYLTKFQNITPVFPPSQDLPYLSSIVFTALSKYGPKPKLTKCMHIQIQINLGRTRGSPCHDELGVVAS